MKKLLAFLIVAIVLPLGASAATRDEEIAVLKAQLSLLKSELELLQASREGTLRVTAVPILRAITPSPAQIGSALTITGELFTETNNQFIFWRKDGVVRTYAVMVADSRDGTTVETLIPSVFVRSSRMDEGDALYVPTEPGDYYVRLVNAKGESNTLRLSVNPAARSTNWNVLLGQLESMRQTLESLRH